MFLVGRVVVFGGESLSFNPLPMNQVTWVSSFCCGFVKGNFFQLWLEFHCCLQVWVLADNPSVAVTSNEPLPFLVSLLDPRSL